MHHFIDPFDLKHQRQTPSIPVFRALETSKLKMEEELRLGVQLVEMIIFKKPTWDGQVCGGM